MKKFITALLLFYGSNSTVRAQYWRETSSGTSKNLYSISFGDTLVGYISGADSLLLKTTDGGISWTSLIHSGIDYSVAAKDLIDIRFVSKNTGFVLLGNKANPLYQGALYKTVDGGTTWTLQDIGNMVGYKLYLFDENNGYIAGAAFFSGKNIAKLHAGDWKEPFNFYFDPSVFLKAVDFYSSGQGIVGGDGGYVYRTFDGGTSWDTVNTYIDTTINELLYLNDSTILAATDNKGTMAILISTDSGKTWTGDPFLITFSYPNMKAMVRSQKDSLIIVGNSRTTGKGIIYSFYRDTWMAMDDAPYNLWDVTMRDKNVAYMVGDSGLIMTNRDTIRSLHVAQAPGFDGVDIFPNPASSRLYVRTPEETRVSLFTIQGLCLYKSPEYSFLHSLDLSAFPAAVYLISIDNASGKTLRRVLMKQ